MSVSLIVPWRPDGAERDRNWAWLRARYEQLYSDWEIVLGTCEGKWSKGTAVNEAARRSHGEVLIVLDADILLGADVLPDAVERLERAPWVVPHGMVYRLTGGATRAVINGRLRATPGKLSRGRTVRTHKGPAGGGAVVTRREDFETVGGVDERFTGWGGEDISFARALDTLVGPHDRLGQVLWHLHHDPMSRRPRNRASEANEKLAAEYLEASGDSVAMAKLCEPSPRGGQGPYDGVAGGGAVVAPREVVLSTPLDPRFVGWG